MEEHADALIVREILQGKKSSYAHLVRRYNQRLFRVGMSYLCDGAEVEDAMQEAYVKAFYSLHKLAEHEHFGTWLTRILINECLQRIRKKKRAIAVSGTFANTTMTDDSSGEEAGMQKEFSSIFEECLQAIPEKYRVVYMMREVEKMSVADTATAAGISETNVRARHSRAKDLLKQKLLDSYPLEDLYQFMGARCEAMLLRVMAALNAV